MSFAGLHEVVENVAALKTKTGHHGHDALDESTAFGAVGTEAFLAPDDRGSQVSFGEIVGGLDTLDCSEGPHRGFHLQDLGAHTRDLRGMAAHPLGFATGLRPSSLRPLRRDGATPNLLWDRAMLFVRRSQTKGEAMQMHYSTVAPGE